MNESLISGSLAPSEYGKVSKQLSEVAKVLELDSSLQGKLIEREDLKELISMVTKSADELELVELAREELQACTVEIGAIEESIKMMLLPKGIINVEGRGEICVYEVKNRQMDTINMSHYIVHEISTLSYDPSVKIHPILFP
jgi:protein subunit release factor A